MKKVRYKVEMLGGRPAVIEAEEIYADEKDGGYRLWHGEKIKPLPLWLCLAFASAPSDIQWDTLSSPF